MWKSINSGRTWTPVFDSQPVASIGAIGVAPSSPEVVYVGTGEADMRDSIAFGNGMYKSTDGGKTWTHIGLENTRQIGRVIVDPKNPNIVFVAALGHAYGPNPDRGVYRSRDGGATWQKVLFKNDDVGAIDLAFDPAELADHLRDAVEYAGVRPGSSMRRRMVPAPASSNRLTAARTGSRLPVAFRLRASDASALRSRRRITIASMPSSMRRPAAFFDQMTPAQRGPGISGDNRIWGRGWYFSKVVVDPKNADIVYVSNTSVYRSTDAGKTWTAIKGAPGGDDYHQLWINPDDPKRMILGSDQGAIVTVDGAETWSSWYNQSTAQIYHVAPDYRFPYWVTGAQQDSGAVGVPTRSSHSEISNHDWTGLCAGGEAGYTAPDPLHPEILYGGTVTRCNVVTGATQNVSPERGPGPFRHAWTQPLVFSQADPHALLLRQSVSLQDDERRRELDAD